MEITNIINIGDSILPKISASIDGIQFNNIPPAEKTGTKGTTFWSSSANINVWKNGGNGRKWKSAVNVVDIDWNGALMRFNDTSRIFNSTGDLLKYIQDLHDEVINNELTVSSALNLLNSRIIQSGNSGGGSTVVPSYDYGLQIASLGNDLYINIPDLEIYKYEDHDGDQSSGVTTTWHLDIDRLDSIDILDINEALYIGNNSVISKDNETNTISIGDSNVHYLELKALESVYRLGDRGKKYELLDLSHFNLTLYYTKRGFLSDSSGEIYDSSNTAVNVKSTTGDFLKLETVLGVGDNATSFNMYFPLAEYTYDQGRFIGKLGLISGEDKYKLDNALTTNNLKLNYSNSQLSLMSGSTKLGTINLANIRQFSVTKVDNNKIKYNNTDYQFGTFIYNNCTSELSLIKILATNYSDLNYIVEFVGRDSLYKYFVLSGLFEIKNNKIEISLDSVSKSYKKLLISIANSTQNVTLLRDLSTDARPKAELKISNPSTNNIYPGETSQIIIKSNIKGNITVANSNTEKYDFNVIKISSTDFIIQINNKNQESTGTILGSGEINIIFTPISLQYQQSEVCINDDDAITIYGCTNNLIAIYSCYIDEDENFPCSDYNPIYTNSNNYLLNTIDKNNSQNKISFSSNDTTDVSYSSSINSILIDDFAVGILYDDDFYNAFNDNTINLGNSTIKVNGQNNKVINYRVETVPPLLYKNIGLSENLYKNQVVKVPSCGKSGDIKFEIFPSKFNFSGINSNSRIYMYNPVDATLIDITNYSGGSNDNRFKLTKIDMLNYSLSYNINKNDTSKFKEFVILFSNEILNSVRDIYESESKSTALVNFIQEPKSYRRVYFSKIPYYQQHISLEDFNIFSSRVIGKDTTYINIFIDNDVSKRDYKFVLLVPESVNFNNYNNLNKTGEQIIWDDLTYTIYSISLNATSLSNNNFSLELS